MILGIDGNAIDMATLGVGVLAVLPRPVKCFLRRSERPGRSAWDRQKAVTDFLNGASVVPFAVMAGSTFWTGLLNDVLNSKISLGLAGTVGFFFILGEVLSAGSEDDRRPPH